MKILESIFRRIQLGPNPLPSPDEVKRATTYPPPYPSGWYRLCDSEQIRPGEVMSFEVVGEHLVLFRSDTTGELGVLDAHCPHLGANLGAGRVKEGCLECPFHKWTFEPSGQVADIPYTEQVQRSLRTRSWPVLEQHGMVFFYYQMGRSERDGPITPPYSLVEEPEIDRGDMVYRGRYDAGEVNMHLVEFAENSVDVAHFEPLHGNMLIPFLGLPVPGIKVHHEAEWKPDEEHAHIAYFLNKPVLHILGKERPQTRADAQITFCGPGSVVTFRFMIPDLGDIILYQTHTPIEEMKQQTHFRWFAEPSIPRVLVYYIVGNWISQWRADINIWENKIYQNRPMLVRGDGPVHRLRRWFQQFYEVPAQSIPVSSTTSEASCGAAVGS